jgi:glycosyltransferase involved in cell wall biosynthesis
MRVLLSAFSCAPNFGSEAAVGWNWAVETARLGHEVLTLTETEHRGAIEAALAKGDLPGTLRFEFFMPAWLDRLRRAGRKLGLQGLNDHWSHLVWQIFAYRHARKHLAAWRVDLVHHITYGGIRHPTLMGRLPVPLVLGPLGGGERAPLALRSGFGWRGWLKDLVRDLHTFAIRLDPITRQACADALVIYVKTEHSRQALPARYRDKVAVRLEIGTHEITEQSPRERGPGEPLQLLFAGRFLYWKGMHLGLKALAEVLGRGIEARLTMLGRGPDEQVWRRLAAELDIGHAVDWIAWVEHREVGAVYQRHDALLFPSLHDSSGNAPLEALAQGLPVVCLDLGGPAVIVDASCGRIVPTTDRNEAAVVQGLADAIEELARSPALCRELGAGARARARSFSWAEQAGWMYADISRRLECGPGGPARRRVPGVPDTQFSG